MQTYLVGGAVRDQLLGLEAKDKDWVVVGTTPSDLKNLGYKQIFANFPVFLHPKTNEEYALARTECKVDKGYHGFDVCFDSSITLQEDLKRRDLTINSIAKDQDGKIIDPFDGQKDLLNRILRHTSQSFKEDPLRVIRLARFMAQLHFFDFCIADETKLLAKEILKTGELDHLTKERINIEFKKALDYPNVFFDTLNSLDCLKTVFPTINEHLEKIPNESFFNHDIYKTTPTKEKIALMFYKLNSAQLDLIKDEINLSKNHHNLATAISEIHQLTTKTYTAEAILHTLRKTNILRDKNLFEKSFTLYSKLATILDRKNLFKELANLELTIISIQTIDVKALTKYTPNNSLGKTITKLYTDTIRAVLLK